jgi:hypothetical protein
MYGGMIPMLAGAVYSHAGVKRGVFHFNLDILGLQMLGSIGFVCFGSLNRRFPLFPLFSSLSLRAASECLSSLFACLYLLIVFSSHYFFQMWSNSLSFF